MLKLMAGATALTLLIACGPENRSGLPETETTGTVQSVQETSTASATTTGESGGTLTAMTPEDKEFVTKAGMGGLFEVQAGNLALQKTSNQDVRSFAQRMVADHSKANAELAQFATAKGIGLATELGGEQKAAFDHLTALNGAAFDKAYMDHMVSDHATAVSDFEKASTSAMDADLKAWAGKTLPTLQDHARLAGEVSGKV